MRKQIIGAVIGLVLVASTFSTAYGVQTGDERPSESNSTEIQASMPKGTKQFVIRGIAPNGRAQTICRGGFKGGQWYDRPHPGKSSNRRAINAHLKVTCVGPGAKGTTVHVRSVMRAGKRARASAPSKGMGGARTGGDLRCVKKKRAYRAHGFVRIKFPPGYTPPGGTRKPVSAVKVFKKNPKTGKCVRP